MKKTLLTLFAVLTASFVFAGNGTKENPYTVADVLAATMDSSEVYVKGYIVGSCTGTSISTAEFGVSDQSSASNILLADTQTENNVDNVIAAQMPTAVREGLSLKNVPENYGKIVVVKAQLIKYFGKNGIKNISEYEINGEGITPTLKKDPSNTPEKAYTIAQAIEIINNKDEYDMSKEVYTKGAIKSIKSLDVSKWPRAQYWITDSLGRDSMQVYNGYYLGGNDFTANDQIKVGDKVIVYGKLTLYGTTYEIAQNNYIYSLNGKTKPEGGDTTVVVSIANTPETAYTAKKAIALIDAGQDLNTPVYVMGKISYIKEINTQYGNATFEIADSTSTLTIYRTKYLDNENFTSEDQLKVNDNIIVYGKLQLYTDKNNNKTYELTNGQLCKVNDTVANGISQIVNGKSSNGQIYDLSGRRVERVTKGIYIVNGKKFVK